MRKRTPALLGGAVVLIALLLSWQSGCQDRIASQGIAKRPAGTTTSAVVPPKALRLAGDVVWGKLTYKFEIILGGSSYCRREWWGAQWDDRNGRNLIEIILPYWSGQMSAHGGNYGYADYRNVRPGRHYYEPARRLWPQSGLVGVTGNEVIPWDAPNLETFEDIHRHGTMNIPHRIIMSERAWGIEGGGPPHWIIHGDPKVYIVKEVEFLYTDQTDAIMALRKKYWGDTRYKSYNFSNGVKAAEHVYNGELPVMDMEWYREGGIKQVDAHDENGIPTTRVEWYPNGKKNTITTWTDRTMRVTQWSPDGVKVVEGGDEGPTSWAIFYYLDGTKRELTHQREGRLDGVYQSWDKSGRLVNDGVYRDGEPWSGVFRTLTNTNYQPHAPQGRIWKDGKSVGEAATQPAD
jgi:antitoxin component YwqK of YwqJK toxin-antitoxin module